MLASPLRFNGDAEMRLQSVTLQKMELGEPDASGRRRPVPVEGEVYDLPTDLAIVALVPVPIPFFWTPRPTGAEQVGLHPDQ